MWLVTTNSFPGYWGNGETLPEAVANARSAGGTAPWVARRISDGWTEAYTDGLNVYATYTAGEREDAPPVVAERFLITRGGTIKPAE